MLEKHSVPRIVQNSTAGIAVAKNPLFCGNPGFDGVPTKKGMKYSLEDFEITD
jgi:hypothetical protein